MELTGFAVHLQSSLSLQETWVAESWWCYGEIDIRNDMMIRQWPAYRLVLIDYDVGLNGLRRLDFRGKRGSCAFYISVVIQQAHVGQLRVDGYVCYERVDGGRF